jgi:hypothetical protein
MEEFDADRYIQAAGAAAGLTLSLQERMGVVEQMNRIHRLAQVAMDFELAPHDEIAPRFEP